MIAYVSGFLLRFNADKQDLVSQRYFTTLPQGSRQEAGAMGRNRFISLWP